MSVLVVAAAGVIGAIALSAKKAADRLDPISEELIEIDPPAADGPAVQGVASDGSIVQVENDGAGTTINDTTGVNPSAPPSSQPSPPPNAAIGSGLAPSGCTTCGDAPSTSVTSSKELYATLTSRTSGLSNFEQSRVLSSVGSKTGAIW
jgi:hypothetical protein